MVEKILQHRHCMMCGKAVPVEEDYCSDQCKEDRQAMIGKHKKRTYMMIFLMLICVVVLLVMGGGGQ